MQLGLIHDLIIKCEVCGSIYIVDKDLLEIQSYSYERNMGAEIECNFIGVDDCEKCGNEMNYTINGYEYPIGALNYSSFDSTGCVFLIDPSIDLFYYVFDFDFYEEGIINKEINKTYSGIKGILEDENIIFNIDSRVFEELVSEVFKRQGYEINLTPQTRDGGYDILATKDIDGLQYILLIECKRYAKNNPVSVDLVRSLYGVHTDQKANKSVIVTTSRYTTDARKFAENQNHLITLMDIDDLLKML